MKKIQVLRTPKPRNPIVRALVLRLSALGAGRHMQARHPSRQAHQRDLAQRVRESGEW